jgi:hypothetical protein
VYFSLDGFRLFWDPKYVPGYPQIMPITEFYTGSRPVLCFDTAEALARDLAYLVRTSPQGFSPVLVTSDRDLAERVRVALNRQGLLNDSQPNLYDVMGKSVIDMTNILKWGR